MPSLRVSVLTKQDIASAARNFQWTRQLPKWTVIVEGRELPARPLILDAAGVPPNDPTNSHQAVALLQDRGFEVRYQGRALEPVTEQASLSELEELIRSLRGSVKGGESLVEMREHEHKIEKHLSRG
jgi:hypothetical protein